ncbi:hypothetical protein C8F01DRAFT_1142657 [Mycena amicta]|nr:hypothetical protein C8F01DRAFT_1142657 [Mycena amicta]
MSMEHGMRNEDIIEIDDSEDENPRSMPPPLLPPHETEAESDYEDSDTERDPVDVDEKPLLNPSINIKDDFAASLKEGFTFDGTFAYSERFAIGDAPNPCLNIQGLGLVGSPLSDREARVLLEECAFVATTPETWEISAEKFQLSNPSWDKWVQTTVGDAASKALDTDTTVTPTFTLQRLVIHGADSRPVYFRECIGDDDLDDLDDPKIGEMTVVLPSAFEGAALQLRWSGQKKSFNLAHQSGLSTSVIAAYSGVEQTMSRPLADSAERLRPTLPDLSGPVQKLRHVLLSWKQNPDAAPEYIAGLLQHLYDKGPRFSTKSLAWKDALLVSQLLPLARLLGFRLHFAHVETTIRTRAHAGRYLTDDSDSDSDASEIDDDEFDDDDDDYVEDIVVSQITDLNGMPASVELDLAAEGYACGSLDDSDPEVVKFERNDRTNGTRTKVYKRVAFLIWPKNTNLDLSVGVGDMYDYALNALRNSFSSAPTKKEKKIIQRLAVCCRMRPREAMLRQVVHVLRESAVRWNDPQPFLDILAACGVDRNIDILGIPAFVSRSLCRDAMQNDRSNLRRWSLLGQITRLEEDDKDPEVARWCEEQALMVLRERLGPVDAAQIPWLVTIAIRYGGLFFQHHIFPQLTRQKLDVSFLVPLISQLHQNTARARIPDPQVMHDIISHWDMQPRMTLAILQLCVSTKNEGLCEAIVQKMQSAARLGQYLPAYPPWRYYIELLEPVLDLVNPAEEPLLWAVFRPFVVNCVSAIVSRARTMPGGFDITPCALDDKNKGILVIAAQALSRHSNSLSQCFAPEIICEHDSQTLQDLAKLFVKELPRDGVLHESDADVIWLLGTTAITKFDTQCLVKPSIAGQTSPGPSEHMLRLLQFCFDLKVRTAALCDQLLRCFFKVPNGTTMGKHVGSVLAPFCGILANFLRDRGISWTNEPFKHFAAGVVVAFVHNIVPQKPTDNVVSVAQLHAVGCNTCQECHSLRDFLLSPASQRTSISFPRTKAIRSHLEEQLRLSRAATWGVVVETLGRGSARTLQVTRPARILLLSQWAFGSSRAEGLMALLGDVTAQKSILGADYNRVYERVYAEKPQPLPLTDVSQTVNLQGKRPATADAGSGPGKKPKVA